MDPAISSLKPAAAADPSLPAQFCEGAIALLLCAGLLYPLVNDLDRLGHIVSIADADQTIVVSLAGLRTAAAVLPSASPFPPDDVSLAAAADTNPPAVTSWPSRLRDMIVERARETPQALATVIGIASTYNPFHNEKITAVQPTASGEHYDAEAWTAAIQIDLRDQFGGVRYGQLYRPAFALIEHGDRRAIVKINDVGPLRPGRVIDLNERAMRYFDPSMQLGLIHGVKISLLPADDWTPGPVEISPPISVASTQ